MTPNKAQLLDLLRARVRDDLEGVRQSQKATQAGATHSESRAEGPKDTRATESSYLARGLAERVEELEGDLAMLAALAPVEFPAGAAVAVGALVTLAGLEDEAGVESHYFLAPAGGGETLAAGGISVRALTAQSPVGRQLVGRREDDEIVVARPRGDFIATIKSVR